MSTPTRGEFKEPNVDKAYTTKLRQLGGKKETTHTSM